MDQLERLHVLTRSDCTTLNKRKAARLATAYDALEESFRNFNVRRDPACPACGENAGEIVIAEYDDLCLPHATLADGSTT